MRNAAIFIQQNEASALMEHRLPAARPAREFFAYDRFAEELGQALGTPVPVIEDALENIPTQGFILLHSGDDPDSLIRMLKECGRDDAVPRLVPIGVAVGTAVVRLRQFALSAVLEQSGYFDWQERRQTEPGRPSGLVANAEAARRAGLTIDAELGTAALVRAEDTLPHLLARLLQASETPE